jgi:hypothetical protein
VKGKQQLWDYPSFGYVSYLLVDFLLVLFFSFIPVFAVSPLCDFSNNETSMSLKTVGITQN